MLASLLIVQQQAARIAGRRGQAVAWSIAALPIAAGAIAAERLDLFAVAFVMAALAVLLARPVPSRGDAAAALALLALGTATKLFPAVVAAVALSWLWGRGLRRAAKLAAATFAAVLLVACLPFAVVSPSGFAEQFRFQSERPVQIESTPATVLRLVGGAEVSGVEENPNRFRSQALEGGPTAAVGGLFAALQLAAVLLAALWARAAARRSSQPETLLLPAAAALLGFAALGKVFSPQFALWVAPLAPLLWIHRARAAAALVVVALVLTQVEYPARYANVVEGDATGVALLLLRNGALVLALVLLLARVRAMADAARADGRSSYASP
jgi:uncharacterized membrane protein